MPLMKLLIDVDTGVDDAFALRYLLSKNKDIEIVGITCLSGNVALPQVLENTRFVTAAFAASPNTIPVVEGCSASLIDTRCLRATVHGDDGIGGVSLLPWYQQFLQSSVTASNTIQQHAAQFILECSQRYSGELVILALAPLTNLALAQKLDPQFGSRLQRLIIMGGNYQGMGNTKRSVGAEFNFACDPEAAHIVLHGCRAPIDIMPYETCIKVAIPNVEVEALLQALHVPASGEMDIRTTAQLGFLQTCLTHFIAVQRRRRNECVICDLMAALLVTLLLDDKSTSSSVEWLERPVTVELEGQHTRGMLVLDWMHLWGDQAPHATKQQVRIAIGVAEDKVRQCYKDTVSLN